jgi:hypothetical protein
MVRATTSARRLAVLRSSIEGVIRSQGYLLNRFETVSRVEYAAHMPLSTPPGRRGRSVA